MKYSRFIHCAIFKEQNLKDISLSKLNRIKYQSMKA